MILSKETFNILRNFSFIHQSIIIPPGNCVTTAKQSLAVVARATIEENIPCTVSIADLPRFLMLLSSAKNYKDIDFQEKLVIITLEDDSKIKYLYTPTIFLAKTYGFDKNGKTIFPYEIKNIKTDDDEIRFKLTSEEIEKLLNISSNLNSEEILFYTENNSLYIKSTVSSNDTSNEYVKRLLETEKSVKVKVAIENFKLFKTDYVVSIHNNIVKLNSLDEKLTYFMIGTL